MAELVADSFGVSAVGTQYNSQKATQPCYSFGTSNRERHLKKVFISKKHCKHTAHMESPGPVYQLPGSMGLGVHCDFGTSTRPKTKAPYPDTSVDLLGATVDSQGFKFSKTQGVHFGTSARDSLANAEVIRTNPSLVLGRGVPGSGEYDARDDLSSAKSPRFTFGVKTSMGEKADQRTPRTVGPGAYPVPQAMGSQCTSDKASEPAFSFGGTRRKKDVSDEFTDLLHVNPKVSGLGKQYTSKKQSAPEHSFGTSTRSHAAKVTLLRTMEDKGPAAALPTPRFHIPMTC